MDKNRGVIYSIMNDISFEYRQYIFLPLLEDDFVARFYYHLLKAYYDDFAKQVFVKTRIYAQGLNSNNKYDISLGSRATDVRDYIRPDSVLEFKMFALTFLPPNSAKDAVKFTTISIS